MFQSQQLIQAIQEAEHGTARMEIMANAIQEADNASEHYWRIYFRYEYIKESIFHEDNFKAIIMFPTLLQVFDEHPELEDDTYDDVMQAFKWILENMPDYYQISREEIERYYDEYEKRCKKYGFSLRVYYMKKSKFYLPINRDAAMEAYRAFRDCKRDSNSDCEACEINHDMEIALEIGREEEAMQIAAPILSGSKRCGEVPHVTYGKLTKHFLYQGNVNEAFHYGALCERYTNNEPEFLEESGYLLELYSVISPSVGWGIFKRNVANFVHSKNPVMRMTFARGAYRLLRCIAKETEYSDNILLRALPLQRSSEGYRVEDMISYFYDIAKQQCELLDKRNGTDYYMNILETTLPDAEMCRETSEDAPKSAVKHGLIPGVPAVFAAVPHGEISLEAANQNLENLSENVKVLSRSTEDNVLFITMEFEGTIFEAHLWVETEQKFSGRPCYGIEHEHYEALEHASAYLMMQMDYSGNAQISLHLVMKLLNCMLPDMLGVVDLLTQKAYPANWVKFAGDYTNAVSVSDLFGLYITGSEETDEIWMTTVGLCTMGMRELEVIGANRRNYGQMADLLHFSACQCIEHNMLPDEGEDFAEVSIGGNAILLTWKDFMTTETSEDSIAGNINRTIPSGVLHFLDEEQGSVLPAEYPPMQQGEQISFPNSHGNFVRRIYLAKETLACFQKALQLPLKQAAVRLEFTLSAEMRQKCGYGKELLWAEISEFDGERITAKLAETSELLPELDEGKSISVTEENITAWLIRPENSEDAFTEEDAFCFM